MDILNRIIIINDLGKIIQLYRNIYELSQQQLAEILDVSIRTVSHWENGRIPRYNNLNKIMSLNGFYECIQEFYKKE